MENKIWNKKYHVESSMINDDNGFAMFLGRWQPLHEGHKQLFAQALNAGKNICIMIRDTPVSEKNPFTPEQVKQNIEENGDFSLINAKASFFNGPAIEISDSSCVNYLVQLLYFYKGEWIVSYEGPNFFGWFPSGTPVGSLGTYRNQWVHFAITRLNGVIKVFKNGQQLGTDINNTSNIVHSTGLTIANETTPTIAAQFGGYITNFHIMKASKYLTSFTPDTSKPIPPTSQTVFLLDCDDPSNVSKDYVGLNSTSTSDNFYNAANPFGF
jgi:hypothetical protein